MSRYGIPQRTAVLHSGKRVGGLRWAELVFVLGRLISQFVLTATHKFEVLSEISFIIRSQNSSALISSVFSLSRVRTFTFPASASLSPTTSMKGTFCIACSRIFAFIFSLRASTSTLTDG